ncbi:flagellar filament capping protein FliD [Marinomonas dokdonensis]|uniref:flagellar filament capping protein FliD n=1 Tax=Marinomonas dokdonensis TaxID=328224 RepID=UPI0040556321
MSVGSLGAGSGLDLESLVKNMVSAQRDTKVKLYNDKLEGFETKLSALGSVGAAIDSFKSSVKTLNDETLFTGRNAIIDQEEGNESIAISTDNTASNGSYAISVNQTASGSRIVSADGLFSSGDDIITTVGGNLNLSAGDDSFTLTVEPGTTLSQLRSQINNSAENFGVSANLVDDGNGNLFLTMTSSKQGAENTLRITNEPTPVPEGSELVSDVDDDLESPALIETGFGLDSVSTEGLSAGLYTPLGDEAKDAIITVDGISIRNDTNTFEDAVSGLTIEALAISDKPANVDISYDQQTVKEAVETFISSYNEMVSVLKQSSAKGAVLSGNSMIRNLQNSLSSELMSSSTNTGVFSSIFDIGIEMQNNAVLSFDNAKFDSAMKKGYTEVSPLFTGDTGLAESLDNLLDNYTGSQGMNNTLKESVRRSIDDTEESLNDYEKRMERYESTLRDKFTGLDSQLAGMNAQGNYLNSMLEKL